MVGCQVALTSMISLLKCVWSMFIIADLIWRGAGNRLISIKILLALR